LVFSPELRLHATRSRFALFQFFFQNPTFGTRILMINPPAKKVLSQVGKIDLRLPQVEKKQDYGFGRDLVERSNFANTRPGR